MKGDNMLNEIKSLKLKAQSVVSLVRQHITDKELHPDDCMFNTPSKSALHSLRMALAHIENAELRKPL